MSDRPVPRRSFGNTSETISVLGFGGVIITNTSPVTASRYVAEDNVPLFANG